MTLWGEYAEKGGPGSGNHGHRGRPGEVGGSTPGDMPRAIVNPGATAKRLDLPRQELERVDSITHELVHEPNAVTRRQILARKSTLSLPDWRTSTSPQLWDAAELLNGTNRNDYSPHGFMPEGSHDEPLKPLAHALYADRSLSQAMYQKHPTPLYRGMSLDLEGQFARRLRDFMDEAEPHDTFTYKPKMIESWSMDPNFATSMAMNGPSGSMPAIFGMPSADPADVLLHSEAVPSLPYRQVVMAHREPQVQIRADHLLLPGGTQWS